MAARDKCCHCCGSTLTAEEGQCQVLESRGPGGGGGVCMTHHVLSLTYYLHVSFINFEIGKVIVSTLWDMRTELMT
jgi:hypothetical protein